MTASDQRMSEDEELLESALLASYLDFMQHSSSAADSERGEANRREQSKLESTPPASTEVLRLLPILELREEDLSSTQNRECCICLEAHEIGERAVRLPSCQHIFHRDCCRDWLSRKCTCPYCRFEYETDDAQYEQQHRQHANNTSAIATDGQDRDHHQGPEPKLAFTMAALRRMTVPQLKKLINKEAGVFFEKEVTKKDDMITVFVNSGRVRVLPPGSASMSALAESADREAAEKKRDASIKRGSSRRLRTKIRRLFGPRSSATTSS